MNSKKLLILGIVFAVFLAAALFQFFPLNKPNDESSVFQRGWSGLTSKQVLSIEISDKMVSLDLDQKDGNWLVKGKKADQEKISALLSNLINQPTVDLISESGNLLANYDLAATLSARIRVNSKQTLLLGKSNSEGIYVRFEQENKVYLLRNLFTNNFSTAANSWYDKTVLKVEQESLKRLSLEKKSEQMAIIRENNLWKFEDDQKEVNKDKLDPILTNISSMTAMDLSDTVPVNSLVKVLVEFQNGKESLEFFQGKNDYFVKRGSDGQVFIIGEYIAKDFQVSRKDLTK